MTSLPHELYRLIVENTSSLSDLCVMARVSHNMRPEAERLIWRDVSLRGDDKFFQVFTVIRPTSNIWLYITTLVLEDAHQNEQYRPTFYNTIATVLQRMKNLRDLTLYFMRGSITSTAYCYSWPFERNIRFPFNLRSFHGAFLIEEKLFSFLETQPNLLLVDLWMGSRSNTYFPPALFTPSILPNLRVLDAKNVRFPSPHILPAILSGRSITHLAIYSLDERNLRALEPVASSIKALKMASPPSQSLGLALVFPNLDHIGLYFLEKQVRGLFHPVWGYNGLLLSGSFFRKV
jgi:hypothetical protein